MRGVTLIELLTVVTILAILSSMAVASYRRYVVRTNRTDATTLLLRIQVAQEKYFLQNNIYADTLAKLGFNTDLSAQGYYKVALAAAAGADFTTTYVATATAQGKQAADDSKCQKLTIDDKGMRTSTPDAASVCWH
jgi:type IV pilus assembly protein PilE